MKVIGITGGIGSGKSIVAKILMEQYNAVFLDTDQIAKEQMEPGGVSYQGVVEYFGRSVLQEDGFIHRVKLAEIVFQDEEKLLKLNQLTHPNVIRRVQELIDEMRNENSIPYVVMETALMIEAQMESTCDEVWYVYTPEDARRQRLKASRNYSDEKIDAIFMKQKKEEEFFAHFHKVIRNTGDMALLEKEIKNLLSN